MPTKPEPTKEEAEAFNNDVRNLWRTTAQLGAEASLYQSVIEEICSYIPEKLKYSSYGNVLVWITQMVAIYSESQKKLQLVLDEEPQEPELPNTVRAVRFRLEKLRQHVAQELDMLDKALLELE